MRVWAPTVGASGQRYEELLVRQVEGNQRRMSSSPLALGRALPLRRLLMGARPHLLALLLAQGEEE